MDVNKYLYAHQNTLYNIDIDLELNTTECCAENREKSLIFVSETAICADH